MTESPAFIQHALRHRDLLQEYCDISVKLLLSDTDADRISDILTMAETDPMLSFLIDEIDHILAHLYRLIDDSETERTQRQLQQTLNQNWLDQTLLNIANRLQDPQTNSLSQSPQERHQSIR
ncbi:MAG: hypothetical protein F6J97_04690 [Leptolyngbya sp. SIO4C1]|nr:hypothetical protein [Leptolyngbya sp. SIO4C1]